MFLGSTMCPTMSTLVFVEPQGPFTLNQCKLFLSFFTHTREHVFVGLQVLFFSSELMVCSFASTGKQNVSLSWW